MWLFRVFFKLGKNCPHLEYIDLSGVNVTMRSLKEMSSKCCKLKVSEKIIFYFDSKHGCSPPPPPPRVGGLVVQPAGGMAPWKMFLFLRSAERYLMH